MDYRELNKATASMLKDFVLGALFAGAGVVLLVQWLWPTVKAWIHWATS